MIQIDERTFKLDKAAAQARVRQARADIAYLTRDIENLKADVELARSNMELSRKEMERLQALSLQQFASKNQSGQGRAAVPGRQNPGAVGPEPSGSGDAPDGPERGCSGAGKKTTLKKPP